MAVDLEKIGKGIHRHVQEQDFQFGVQAEQKRIIKLLENPLHHNIRFPDEHINCYTCELIALIKGEK